MFDILEMLTNLAGPIMKLSKDRRDLRDNALRAISHALNETYIYYSSLENGKRRNKETEAQLSKYWAAAAIPIRHLDKNLATTCEYKSEYWLYPTRWDDARIKKFGIALDEVRERYRELLQDK